MPESITIILQPEVQSALDELITKEGSSTEVIINEALKEYLFFKQLRSLRERMTTYARSKGIYTDDDVFNIVS